MKKKVEQSSDIILIKASTGVCQGLTVCKVGTSGFSWKKATLRVIYRAENQLTNLFVVSSRGNSASLKICERSLCRKKHVLRRV